jgi:hypothetical protein
MSAGDIERDMDPLRGGWHRCTKGLLDYRGAGSERADFGFIAPVGAPANSSSIFAVAAIVET